VEFRSSGFGFLVRRGKRGRVLLGSGGTHLTPLVRLFAPLHHRLRQSKLKGLYFDTMNRIHRMLLSCPSCKSCPIHRPRLKAQVAVLHREVYGSIRSGTEHQAVQSCTAFLRQDEQDKPHTHPPAPPKAGSSCLKILDLGVRFIYEEHGAEARCDGSRRHLCAFARCLLRPVSLAKPARPGTPRR